MKLFEINYRSNTSRILIEGYGLVNNFDYHGDQVTDPRPKALTLGKWRSPKGNNLMAGINLNYLSDEQIKRLQQNLQPVLRSRNLKTRARTLRNLMPDIFNAAYRTYYKDAVANVDRNTLRFLSVDKEILPSKPTKDLEVPEPEEKPTATTDVDDVTAPKMHDEPVRKPEPKPEPEAEEPEAEEPEAEEPDQDFGTDETEIDQDDKEEEEEI